MNPAACIITAPAKLLNREFSCLVILPQMPLLYIPCPEAANNSVVPGFPRISLKKPSESKFGSSKKNRSPRVCFAYP